MSSSKGDESNLKPPFKKSIQQIFSQVEPELRKWGFGTGKVNANVYAKLNDFMNVHKVPSVVVVYNENPYPVPLADLYRGSQPLKEFCENLASSSVVIEELSTEEKAESFMNKYPKTMRPRIWLITEKDTVAGMFSSIASQFRGEIDFAFSKFNDDAINMIRVSLKISEPSLVFFKGSSTRIAFDETFYFRTKHARGNYSDQQAQVPRWNHGEDQKV